MNLTVIGTGYVGLVTGACFSEMGNHVTCVDSDPDKIRLLQNGIIPIYEPGLANLVMKNLKCGLLDFSTSLRNSMQKTDIFFISVGTPNTDAGSTDIEHVMEAAREIAENMQRYSIIVNKSTVPVGTCDRIRIKIGNILKTRGANIEFDVVSNPEFLKEGCAVADFMKPDRIIIGSDSLKARDILKKLYSPFSRNHDKAIFMSMRDAEMTKYAANCMLAARISFMNEIAGICELFDADVENVRKGIGSDSRIGYSFIYPGCGYGGSCFPKDLKSLINISKNAGFDPVILEAVEKRNAGQKKILYKKIESRFGNNLEGKKLGIWGIAFKPGTDDIRESPAIDLIKNLIDSGAEVLAYDPAAMHQARMKLPPEWFENGRMILVDNQYDALYNADAMILVTEWKLFRQPDFIFMKKNMKTPVIFDGRNLYEPSELRNCGFEYYGIGRA